MTATRSPKEQHTPRAARSPLARRRDCITRLAALAAGGTLTSGISACATGGGHPVPPGPASLPPPETWAGHTPAQSALLDDLERRTFQFFWDTTDPRTGLAPDRWPTPSFASVAAVGFALSAYPIAVARGFITRAQARERALATLRFFHDGPQGPEPQGRIGHRGFFYHFIDMASGTRHRDVELSTIDTALLVAGALHCGRWFDDASDPAEAEIRRLAEAIYVRVDWRWAQPRPPAIGHGWKPETGHLPHDYLGYNEAMLLYLLALGSPTHPVEASAWNAWTSTYPRVWGSSGHGPAHLRYPVLFVHQFTHCWVDFRGLADPWLKARGIDYHENSRRATYAQQAYAVRNPEGWAGYGPNVWGITACDGPADVERVVNGRVRRFVSYAGRGMGGARYHDDGTIAPYGAGSSIVFAPEIVLPALEAMRSLGESVYGRHGFHSFNRSFQFPDVLLTHGRVVPGFGWVDDDLLGIEQGPLLMMLGNHRGELVWNAMRSDPFLRRGLLRAGFSGGWLS